MVLLLLYERVVEVIRIHYVVMEVLHVDSRSRCLQAMGGVRHRQRGTQMHAHSWCVKISRLAVIESVDTSWRWCIIPRRLVRERSERVRIGVHEGGSQSPRVLHWFGSVVLVFDIVQVGEVSEEVVVGQYIVVFVLD